MKTTGWPAPLISKYRSVWLAVTVGMRGSSWSVRFDCNGPISIIKEAAAHAWHMADACGRQASALVKVVAALNLLPCAPGLRCRAGPQSDLGDAARPKEALEVLQPLPSVLAAAGRGQDLLAKGGDVFNDPLTAIVGQCQRVDRCRAVALVKPAGLFRPIPAGAKA